MIKRFGKPAVGSKITVTTEWHDYYKGFAANVKREHTISGVVVGSAKYDDVHSFRLATGNSSYPISVVDLNRVTALVHEDGTSASKVSVAVPQVRHWEVKSDSRKGGSYNVVFDGRGYSCECPGYTFRKSCRHINKVKEAA